MGKTKEIGGSKKLFRVRCKEMNKNTLPKRYPVLCAWCLEKGIEKIIRMSKVKNSHGICKECAEKMFKNKERMGI